MQTYDVIIVGLGAMGSAATYQLAKSGAKVLGIDQFTPPHSLGSTHGDTRITRLAVGEGEEYVALVQRSHEIWKELEAASGKSLLVQCGGLILMPKNLATSHHGKSDFLNRTIAVARQHPIPHEVLTSTEVRARFPAFNTKGNEQAYYEPQAGYVRPEASVTAQLDLARMRGARLSFGEKVLSYDVTSDRVSVTTDKGKYTGAKLVLTVGPWINQLFPGNESIFKIYRQVLYWFDIKDKGYYDSYSKLPIFVWMFGDQPEEYVYGFPAVNGPNGGVKVATEYYITDTSPDTVDRTVTAEEISEMYDKHVKHQLPGLSGNCLRAAACMYTVTPDYKFVIDFHPDYRNVLIASPCSGHGFKHSAAIGEVLAQLATTGTSDIDISAFNMKRFARV